jgi:sugar phosphate isomerase/epimerase
MSIPLQLGIRAHDLPQQSIHHLTRQLNELDFPFIQLAIGKSFPEFVPDLTKMSYGAATFLAHKFKQADIQIAVLGSYVNLSSNNPVVREAALAKFKRHLELAHIFEATFVASETGSVTTGYTTENYTEAAYLQMRASIIELVEFAEATGQTIAIEPGINHPLHSLAVTKRLFHDVQSPRLKLILDFYNLLTPENVNQQEAIMAEAFETFADQIEVFHFKDFDFENGKLKTVPIGTGKMNFEPQLAFIKHQKPGLFTSLEGNTGDTILPAKLFLTEQYNKIK